jgi:hypothetical protein
VVVCWGGRDVYVEVVVVQRDEGKSSLGRRCGCAFGDAEACGDATTELGSLTARTVPFFMPEVSNRGGQVPTVDIPGSERKHMKTVWKQQLVALLYFPYLHHKLPPHD